MRTMQSTRSRLILLTRTREEQPLLGEEAEGWALRWMARVAPGARRPYLSETGSLASDESGWLGSSVIKYRMRAKGDRVSVANPSMERASLEPIYDQR